MEILFLSPQLPAPWNPHSYRMFYGARYLSQKYNHKITLVTFKRAGEESPWVDEVKRYCDTINIIEVPNHPNKLKPRPIAYAFRNMLSPSNILSKRPNLFNYYYSPKMQSKVSHLLTSKKFDLAFTDTAAMVFYLLDTPVAKVLEIQNEGRICWDYYKSARKPLMKIFWLLQYYKIRSWERKFERFDLCLATAEYDKQQLESWLPNVKISVIPLGVDTDYSKPMAVEESPPNLVFVGNLFSPLNEQAILYFCREIYPIVRQSEPGIKLHLVGKNPGPRVVRLAEEDCSITITGFVDDVRPYIARAWVEIAPMVSQSGYYTKVVEAMAMGKAVVSTTAGAQGVKITPGENIITADSPREFASGVIELLRNETLRQRIGANARKLIEQNYSWEKVTDILNELFEKAVAEK